MATLIYVIKNSHFGHAPRSLLLYDTIYK